MIKVKNNSNENCHFFTREKSLLIEWACFSINEMFFFALERARFYYKGKLALHCKITSLTHFLFQFTELSVFFC